MPKTILGIRMYSARETAELLGVTTGSVYKYVKSGKLPGQTIGGRLHVSEIGLKLFLVPQEKEG